MPEKENTTIVYDSGKIQKSSSHPLGAVVSVIRGRIRYFFFGLSLLLMSLWALDKLYYSTMQMPFERSALNNFLATVAYIVMLGAAFVLISYAFRRVRLRQKGFEFVMPFYKKAYLYSEVTFDLEEREEHVKQRFGSGTISDTQTVWVCTISFNDRRRKPFILKSIHYSGLEKKITDLQRNLVYQRFFLRTDLLGELDIPSQKGYDQDISFSYDGRNVDTNLNIAAFLVCAENLGAVGAMVDTIPQMYGRARRALLERCEKDAEIKSYIEDELSNEDNSEQEYLCKMFNVTKASEIEPKTFMQALSLTNIYIDDEDEQGLECLLIFSLPHEDAPGYLEVRFDKEYLLTDIHSC